VHSSTSRAVAVLGATGSIGRATLDVLRLLAPEFQLYGLSGHARVGELLEAAQSAKAQVLVGTHEQALANLRMTPPGCHIAQGSKALVALATDPRVDIVVAAIVGSAGMLSTLAAAEAGKRIALANKESLVVAGRLLTRAAQASGAELIPVDSEHSAIFQAIQAGKPQQVSRIVLTASGGPFRTWTKQQLEHASLEDALSHPTWKMGPKITVDSATMMNKALEIIEARWLFDLPPEKIDVVVHPQSIVHSFVEFVDGSTIAQLSPPDMRLPIQYALTYPDRRACPCSRMDWKVNWELSFQPVDCDRFPAVQLGWMVAKSGGSAGAVLNAANEAAVGLFMQGKLRFVDIVPACRSILEEHHFEPDPDLDRLLVLDQWSRNQVERWAALSG